MIATIDRFEGDDAVLLVRPEERVRIVLPRSLVPEVKEGDIVAVLALRLEADTAAARTRAEAQIERLRTTHRT